MIPQKGAKIKIFDMPSYRPECRPLFPCVGVVTEAYEYTFLVDVQGNLYSLYDDESFEILKED